MQRQFRSATLVMLALLACPAAAHAAQAAQMTVASDEPPAAVAALSPYAFAWSPRTGDAWMDERLSDINVYGDRYRGAFVDELVRYHTAPRALVVELIGNRHWAPGDIYYACALAQVVGRPCRAVIADWERDHEQGWQATAESLEADEADTRMRLKQAIRDSYVRWGRPLADPEAEADPPDAKAAGSPPVPDAGKDRKQRRSQAP